MPAQTILTALRYIAKRLLAIGLTIVLGVFITVIVANSGGMVDSVAHKQVDIEIRQLMSRQVFSDEEIDALRQKIEHQTGLTLPFWQRHLRYTFKALTLDWGDVGDRRTFSMYIQSPSGGEIYTHDSRTIILKRLPNSLLLSGTAYLLLALISLPAALFLSQREGHWLDKLTGALTPISSVPSWVLGALLTMIFAVELRLFPVGKMIDNPPPQTTPETLLVVAWHMVLPVTAIVLSLVFQLIFNWRTFLMIYSAEDYVELAIAKGLTRKAIEYRYILRPVVPYLLTGFTLTLVGFWQSITALEYFFQWPGIGKLFVDALPNFRGESMYTGEMSLVIGIVVLFAYLLGATVLVLDLAYLWVDPRLQVAGTPPTRAPNLSATSGSLARRLRKLLRRTPASKGTFSGGPGWLGTGKQRPTVQDILSDWKYSLEEAANALRLSLGEIRQSPSAMLGLGLVTLMVLSSILVMVFLPYNTIGRQWSISALSGNPTKAKLALPKWVNWFRSDDLPETIILNSQDGTAVKQVREIPGSLPQVQIDFVFDYAYTEFPSEITLYFMPKYTEKQPFVSLVWMTPDGREYQLKNTSPNMNQDYAFAGNVPYRQILRENQHWQKWFVTRGDYPTPGYYILFADPQAETSRLLPGTYTLRMTGTFFEEEGDLDAQLVVFGAVEGWAGTDNLRRDLLVPLLWGMPFALMIGGIGAVVTTLASLLVAAAGVWLGGWVDNLIQRAIEANLILPVIAIGVLFIAFYGINLWLTLGVLILLNILGTPTKAFRAAFLQVKEAGYIEAARVYGTSNWRMIRHYLIPRILPVIIPQMVVLIPNFVFLEATLAIFNISDVRYPTWGNVIYSALRYGAAYGSRYWVLEPVSLLMLTGVAFVLLGFALNRILNPRLI